MRAVPKSCASHDATGWWLYAVMQIRCTFARARSSREYVWSFNDPIARGVLSLARRRPPEDAAAHRTHLAPKTNIYIQLARNGATGQHRALSHNSLNINTPPKSPIPNKRAFRPADRHSICHARVAISRILRAQVMHHASHMWSVKARSSFRRRLCAWWVVWFFSANDVTWMRVGLLYG